MAQARRLDRAAMMDLLPSGRPRFVSAAYHDLDEALDASRELEKRGYARRQVSVFMTTESRSRFIDSHPRYGELESEAIVVEKVELEKHRKTLEGAGAGGTIGGATGAVGAALAAASTTLVVPPLGLAVAGPIAAMLAGGGAGAAAGGLIGAFVGAGMSEDRARRFEALIKEGKIIVGVLAETDAERTNVVEILESHGGDLVFQDQDAD
ncbi:MAG: hypothetical protein WEG36_07405 [Gemmatimonadota bacterium]